MLLRGVATALALLLTGPAAALSIALDTGGLDAAHTQRARQLVVDTLPLLPDSWQADGRILPLRFDPDLPTNVAGHHRLGRLRLAPALLERPPGDDGIDPAQAALIHEISHAMDRSGGRWSADPVFRRLVGWEDGGNDFRLRLPDPQVLQSPAESLAVHMEAWLLDPAYPCREPALAQWFQAHIGKVALARSPCAASLPFLVASGQGVALEYIDPARVWAVDYLLAGSGGGAMSRFGHSMLRVVICAPGRTPGPRCRMDLGHHRVLSFRAFVDDVQISSWRGLSGGYPSRLFVLPLDQIIDEYTRVELRDLRAHAMELDRDGITALLQAAARAHWRYDSRYRFIDNNCAVETGRLLDTALMARSGRLEPATQKITPKGVLRALRRQGWMGPDIAPQDDSSALAGMYFASARDEYRQLLATLQAAGQVAPDWTLARWLAAGSAQRGMLQEHMNLEQAAAWLVLERAALRRTEQRALDGLKRRLGRDAGLDAAVADWQHWLGGIEAPGAMPLGGYGLPQEGELVRASAQLEYWQKQGPVRWQTLRAQAEAALPAALQQELTQTRQRVASLGGRVRQLAGESAPAQ